MTVIGDTMFKKSMTTLMATSAFFCALNANADGRLEGRISDTQGKVYFDGAIVRLKELKLESSSSNGGRFSFNSVPAGTYTLIVDYLGAESVQQLVNITDDNTTRESIKIGENVDPIENVIVVGQAAGANSALNKQRAADNFKSVVSSDSMGQFPDENVSEALQRVPGVFIQRDQGEGRFVGVRGLSPTYNSSSINGLSIPAPEADTRAVALDVIPSGLVESLEVTKSLTSDMDADSVGGNIDVKSLSAFDRDGMTYQLSAEAVYSEQASSTTPKVSGTFTNAFETDAGEFGIAAALSYGERDSATEGHESEWHDNGAIKEDEIRGYEVSRTRIGAALNLEYRTDELNQYYVKTLYSDFEDLELSPRLKTEYEDDGSFDGGRFRIKDRKETQTIKSIIAGGENIIDDWTLEYSAGYSHSQEDEPYRRETDYNYAPSTGIETSVDEITLEDNLTEDEEFSFRFDVTREMEFGGNPGYIKAGLKLREREKFRDATVTVTDDAGDIKEDDSAVGSALDYEIDENITAAYIMSRVDIDNLRIVYGLRYEDTDTDLNGNNVVLDKDTDVVTVTPVEYDNDYSHVLPSINLRYRASDSLIYRAAFTQSISRPGFGEMNPTPEKLEEDSGELELELGNPELDPLESNNFDVSLEYYSKSAGNFGVGLFYKDIDNFIYNSDVSNSIDPEDYFPAGSYTVDKATQFKNGESADVWGVELSYTKNFTNGFLIQANATVTDSDAQLTDDDRDISLPGQSDFVANLTLGYEVGPLSLRLSAAHSDKSLQEVGETKEFDVYLDDRTQIDMTAKYDVNDNLQVYLNAVNLTDEDYLEYFGDTSRRKQHETYGPTFSLGVTYRNF